MVAISGIIMVIASLTLFACEEHDAEKKKREMEADGWIRA